jgi:uncharacterized protein (TIGR00375 family)
MKFIADLHMHSHLSRATSRVMNLENIYKWAQLKGVTVVGTGDFTNPQWFKEISQKLDPAEPGLFVLKPQYRQTIDEEIPESCRAEVRFILSVEISSIYKKHDKTRKVHNLIFFPDLRSVSRLNVMLTKVGNLASDGRPILGLDSKELFRMALDASHETYFVPAHIWTPHFSVLGASSGFDSLEECFEDLTPLIHAVETGLSSDPPMNWRLSGLDKVTLISNSDAHSPDRIGREANIFCTELSYFSILDALNNPEKEEFLGTIEFFPEEGKYHFDGHRACGERLSPEKTIKYGGMCPACGKKVTMGVLHRVTELADRSLDFVPDGKPAFKSLIGLNGVISEIYEVGGKSKKVQNEYFRLLRTLGNELSILMDCPLTVIKNAGLSLLPEAIDNVRNGKVSILPGYDGEYGKVKVFSDKEKSLNQRSLF